MGFLSIIGGLASALFGGGSGGGNQALASQVIDKVLPETNKEKEAAALAEDQTIEQDAETARAYDPKDMPVIVYQPGMGLIPFILLWILDLINHVVDTLNHIIRPGFFIYLIGGLAKKWPLPDPGTVDPRMWTIFVIVVTFFFGGRAITKDILPGVQNIVAAWKK